jgi:hypothetical protein
LHWEEGRTGGREKDGQDLHVQNPLNTVRVFMDQRAGEGNRLRLGADRGLALPQDKL